MSSFPLRNSDSSKMPDQSIIAKTPVPDGGYGWVIAFASFMISWLVDGMLYAYGVMKIPLQEAFKTSEASTLLVGSLCVGVYMLPGPIFSKLTERFGFRNAIIGGTLVTSIFMCLSTMTSSIYALMILYGVGAGFGFGLVYLASLGVLNTYFDKKLNLVNGIVVSGTGIGVLSFGQLSGYLFDVYGWRGGLLILSAIMLNGAVFGALMRPVEQFSSGIRVQIHPPEENTRESDKRPKIAYKSVLTKEDEKVVLTEAPEESIEATTVATTTKSKSSIIKRNLRYDLLSDPPMLLLCLGQIFGMFGYYLVALLLVSVAEREIKATPVQSRMTMTVFGIANTIARAVFGWIANHDRISALAVSNVTLTTCALASFLFVFVKTYAQVMMFSLMFGICSAPYVGLTISCLKEILIKENPIEGNDGQDDYVAGLGLLFFFRGISCIAGPTLGGYMTDATGSYRLAFLVGASGLLIAAILQILIPIYKCFKTSKV